MTSAKTYAMLAWLFAIVIIGLGAAEWQRRCTRNRAVRILNHAKHYLRRNGRYSNSDGIHILTDKLFQVMEGR